MTEIFNACHVTTAKVPNKEHRQVIVLFISVGVSKVKDNRC